MAVEQVDMELEQVDMELEQVDMVPAVCVLAEQVGAMAPQAVAMPAHVESPLGRSAQLVGSAAVAEDPVRVACHTWELARETMSKKQLTGTVGLEAILTLFGQEEISPASSPAAAV